MTFREFKEVEEREIIRTNVHFRFKKLDDVEYMLIVSIATLPEPRDWGVSHHWKDATTTMTSIEAYEAYKNILEGGLE